MKFGNKKMRTKFVQSSNRLWNCCLASVYKNCGRTADIS